METICDNVDDNIALMMSSDLSIECVSLLGRVMFSMEGNLFLFIPPDFLYRACAMLSPLDGYSWAAITSMRDLKRRQEEYSSIKLLVMMTFLKISLGTGASNDMTSRT